MSQLNYYFDEHNPIHPFTHALESNIGSSSPFNALRVEPLFIDGFHPCEKNGKWVQVVDYRNATVYDKQTAQKEEVKELGKLDDNLTTIVPDCQYPIWDSNENKWITDPLAKLQINQARKSTLIANATAKIAVLQDAIELEIAELGDIEKLKAWKIYRVYLERVDVTTEDIQFPPSPDSES